MNSLMVHFAHFFHEEIGTTWLAGGWAGAKEPGVSMHPFEEGAVWSYQEWSNQMAVGGYHH